MPSANEVVQRKAFLSRADAFLFFFLGQAGQGKANVGRRAIASGAGYAGVLEVQKSNTKQYFIE